MQWESLIATAISAVLTLGVIYGVLKTQITQLNRDLARMEEDLLLIKNQYVTLRHFEAVISRIQSAQDDMGRDIKQILELVSKVRY